jgi:23S rRNA-/tRNA-specific pseudouridylate synthase
MDYPPIPLDHHCSVLRFESPGIWALEKATGVLSHPNKESKKSTKQRTLLNADYLHEDECYHWTNNEGKIQKLFLIHRLDSPTSGIILAASSQLIAKKIKSLFSKKEVKKTYYAIIKPNAHIKEGIWKDYLKEKREGGKIRVLRGNGHIALTKVSIERKKSGLYGLAMLRLEPLTGRTHQLRVQCALRGLPIVGDKNYGDFTFNRKIARASKIDRLTLHATEISLNFNFDKEDVDFFADSPLPRSMGKLLAYR